MGDPGNYFYNQDRQYREQPMPRDDFTSFAEANANYCYQLSLWWWNAVYNQQHAATQSWYNRFTDQSCECAERTMTVEGECDCCQNNACFDYERHEIHACKDCPESESYVGPYWHRLHGEHSSVNGNHHGATFSPNVNENSIISHNTDETGEYDDSSGDDGDDDDGNINSSDDDDDSDTNMEVDENFRKFLEQSEKHRQERERRKKEIAAEKDDYIEVGSIHLNTTTSAPSEQPGLKRKEEMNALYGKHASVIMSLEASLQLNYDKNRDMRQPVFWPSIPLKF